MVIEKRTLVQTETLNPSLENRKRDPRVQRTTQTGMQDQVFEVAEVPLHEKMKGRYRAF